MDYSCVITLLYNGIARLVDMEAVTTIFLQVPVVSIKHSALQYFRLLCCIC